MHTTFASIASLLVSSSRHLVKSPNCNFGININKPSAQYYYETISSGGCMFRHMCHHQANIFLSLVSKCTSLLYVKRIQIGCNTVRFIQFYIIAYCFAIQFYNAYFIFYVAVCLISIILLFVHIFMVLF